MIQLKIMDLTESQGMQHTEPCISRNYKENLFQALHFEKDYSPVRVKKVSSTQNASSIILLSCRQGLQLELFQFYQHQNTSQREDWICISIVQIDHTDGNCREKKNVISCDKLKHSFKKWSFHLIVLHEIQQLNIYRYSDSVYVSNYEIRFLSEVPYTM